LKELVMSDLSDRLARLAGRGTPRGAADVFAAASSDATTPATDTPLYRRATIVTAIAASVALVGGIAAALTVGDDKKSPVSSQQAIGTTTTSLVGPTTSTTISEATKVYLASTRLIPFDQCGTLNSYAKREALKVVGPYGIGGASGSGDAFTTGAGTVGAPQEARDSGAAGGAKAAAPLARTDEHSDTNVQEAGIDEPDSVKTDGETIFQVAYGKVFATSTGDSPQLLGSLPIDGGSEMLRIADKLIVISPGGGVYATDSRFAGGGGGVAANSVPYGGGQLKSRFTVVDVSNPRAMKITGHLDVDGSYVSARTVDGVVRLVVRSNPNLAFSYPQDGSPEAQEQAKQHNTDVVRSATADTWLPHFTATDARGREQKGQAFACDASYHPPQFSGFGMLSVLSFNTENPSYTRAASVMADGEIVYASGTRVYVATNSWGAPTADGQSFAPSASTLIHAFDISDPVQAVYRESGKVNGTVLNQFSMSEYKGALRVATTDSAGGSESFVTVLGDSGSALIPVGQVGGLGKGERIYAVRFIGPTGYVVTFRQFDPLYVVDLSEPSKPKVVGSLEVSGYSSYLHPVGEGMLLAVGAEVVQGEPDGVQMSLYDVRDPAHPKMVVRKQFGQGFSGAAGNFDHHAFLYWPKTKLAVVPLNTYSYNSSDQSQNFNGAIGMHVGESAIDEVGRVQPPSSSQNGNPGIQRSVVIGDRLYLTTSQGLLVTRLDNLTQTAWVAYPVDEGQPPPQPQPVD
jgi:uncharacterized secreted protein with C-terminal beta-propeller domain